MTTTRQDGAFTVSEEKTQGSKKIRPSKESLHLGLRNRTLTAYLLLAPAAIVFLVFMVTPVLLTFGLSFFEWSGIMLGSMKFIGLENYSEMFQDEVFWSSLRNNLVFLILGTAAIVLLGLFVAVLLEQRFRGSNFFRGFFFLPTVLSLTVIGIVFSFLLSPEFGIIGPLLRLIGIDDTPALLGEPTGALYTLVAVEIWRSFGFAMFLFVAGLKALDESITEAARLDGAAGWQTFWHVTLPQLRPVTLMASTLVGIGMLKLFDLVYVMTGGGPQNATDVLNTYSYYEGFKYNRVGYAATIALVLLFLTFWLTVFRYKVFPDERREGTGRA